MLAWPQTADGRRSALASTVVYAQNRDMIRESVAFISMRSLPLLFQLITRALKDGHNILRERHVDPAVRPRGNDKSNATRRATAGVRRDDRARIVDGSTGGAAES